VSTKAQTVLDEFRRLDPAEQRLVWNELAQTFAPADYGPLSDDDLTAIADQTFVLLDKEERDAQPGSGLAGRSGNGRQDEACPDPQ
jgi:hypothetical protein